MWNYPPPPLIDLDDHIVTSTDQHSWKDACHCDLRALIEGGGGGNRGVNNW